MERLTLTTLPSSEYTLLDSGDQQKLERYGDVVLARPDPQALWPKTLGAGEWAKTQGRFERQGKEGVWVADNLPKQWQIAFGGLEFLIRPTSFKHTGLFPEQLSNWEWVGECIRSFGGSKISGVHEFSAKNSLSPRADALRSPRQPSSSFAPQTLLQPSSASSLDNVPLPQPKVLNLFGYTGGATLAAAQSGAAVTHVDASKTAVAWARENAAASGLTEKPIRWIVEDVLVFVKREVRRVAESGQKYDGIIMDPPAFGHGPKDELWKIEEDLIELISLCGQLLSDKPLFFLINGYAAGYSPLAFAYNLEQFQTKFGGTIEYGDLAIAQEKGDRVLPCGIFARWKAN